MVVPAPDPEVTAAERLRPARLREGVVADRAHRLAIAPTGRLYRVNYDLGPFSHQ